MSRRDGDRAAGAGAPPGMRPRRGMQAPLTRSLASAPLPDPASRVPRSTLRGAPHAKHADAAGELAQTADNGALWFCNEITEAVPNERLRSSG